MKTIVEMVEARVPPEIEVLFPLWRYGGDRPGKYPQWRECRLADDCIWAWVPHPDLRRGSDTKAFQAAHRRFGPACFYRPPRGWAFRRDCVPVRLWTGRRYRWFWVKIDRKKGG
jgi:hypothetical protein